MAQVWSGKRWGGQIIPRVGQEVVVEFLEGDPDRPLVIGTVYNDEYKLPYELPANKTIGGLKSDSTKGSGGYNEWSFEDKKGSEKIGLHAEKDYELVIRHAETRTIGETFGSGTSRDTTLKNGDDKLDIQNGSQNIKISKDQTIDVQKTITVTANISIELKVGASKILLEQSGITIEAPTINIKSLGPMVDSESAKRVVSWVEEAKQDGAKLLTPARREGSRLWPVIVANVPKGAKLSDREVFGPVATVEPYESFEDALAKANDTPYGLQAAVFTRDIGRASDARECVTRSRR